jgi:trimethylamine--corrinoid protein Co-methyltransferase
MATPTFQLLSQEEKERIHQAALVLLQEEGLRVLDDQALEILAGAGARVDTASKQVHYPPELVERAAAQAPAEFKLYGRDPDKHVIDLREGNVYYTTNGYATQFYDPESGTRRSIDQESLAYITRLADWLDQIDIYAVMGTPEDVPAATNDRYQFAIALANTTKHIWNTAYGPEAVRDQVCMAAAVRGGREALAQHPLFTLDLTVISPMELDGRQASTMIEGARQGLPIGISPGPIAGATAPVTLAGCTTQAVAEVLGAITLVQLVRPGNPVILTHYTRSMDMASGSVTMGGPEFSLLRACTAEMARFYKIPSRGGGMITDSKAADAQMGAEKMMGCLIPTLAGLNIVAGMGQADFINTVRPDLMLIDNEIVRAVRRFARGFAVNDETIATDLIMQVGPGGNFLAADHTRQHFRQELWSSKLWDRKPWGNWEAAGAKDVSCRAWEMIKKSKHTVPSLPADVERAVWDVVRSADARFAE